MGAARAPSRASRVAAARDNAGVQAAPQERVQRSLAMIELSTSQPQTLLQLLQQTGAQCGAPAAPDGLKSCPAERHCTIAGSSVCVRGLADAGAPDAIASPGVAMGSGVGLVLIGVAIGWVLRRR
jgi:hypothetical protein